jgi:GT2 family glycosyltransferase
MQKVVISILHYHNESDTLKCLESIADLDLEGIEIETFVLLNGKDEKLDIVGRDFSGINLTVLQNSYNAGFTGGHNLVYEKVQDKKFDFFLLLNNDSTMDTHCLVEMVNTARSEKIGIVVPKIYFSKGREFHKSRYSEKEAGHVFWYAGGYIDWDNVQSKHKGVDEVDAGQFDKEENITFATGACLLIRKKVIDMVGLFDERYFLYYEDADLSQKVIKAGFELHYQPKAIVWHSNAGSSGVGSALHDYYLTRNRMLFGMKYAPLRLKALLIKESIRFMLNGRKWQKIGVKDYYLHRFGKGSFK